MAGRFEKGTWIAKPSWETDDSGRFVRQESSFRDRPSREHATPGRYRLFVSYACPWAHRTLISRALKNIGDALPVTVVDPWMGDEGWAFRDADRNPEPEPEIGAQFLRELYVHSRADYSGRVTVPVLWDCEEKTIVNNESRDILEILDDELAPLAANGPKLYPDDLLDDVNDTIDRIYTPINNGVYRCGFAGKQSAYDEAFDELFDALDHWNDHLAERKYLCGDRVTAADVCLFTTLVRFDPVYYVHFKCNRRRIMDYDHLLGFMQRILNLPRVADTVHMDHIKEHYYRSHPELNPKGIVPGGPDLGYLHGAMA